MNPLRFPMLLAVLVAIPACYRGAPPAAGEPGPSARGDEIPAAALDGVLAAHRRGLGRMERFEYDDAVKAFRQVHRLAPGWNAGAINLAIALLNQTGSEGAGAVAGTTTTSITARYQEAIALLEAVLRREPASLPAHYCRGLIWEELGELARAQRDFLFVAEHDPADAHAWYKVGSTLNDPERPDRPAGPRQAGRLIAVYSKALALNPNLVNALYKLQAAYGWAGQRDRQKELILRWQELDPRNNPAGPGESAGTSYGEMGRYAQIINPGNDHAPRAGSEPAPVRGPRFALPPAPIAIDLPAGCRWVAAADFSGPRAVIGRARARFGAAVAAFDADGDGKLDLYLGAAVNGPRGVRDALLLNRGERSFRDATEEFGLDGDRASLGVAAGDFDADGRIDLFLTGAGSNRLYRNAGGRFEDVTDRSGIPAGNAVCLTAHWLDLDQDGDLDLYLVNHAAAHESAACFGGQETAPAGLRNAAYRNDGKPPALPGRPHASWAPSGVAPAELPRAGASGLSIAFTPWPEPGALVDEVVRHTAVAALDIDDDRDLDLVLAADGRPLRAIVNDRLGRFHALAMPGAPSPSAAGHTSLLATDLDKDGLGDVVAVSAEGRLTPLRNAAGRWEPWPADSRRWACAVAADLDLDTWPDLVGLALGPAGSDAAIAWARNEGTRLVEQFPWGRTGAGRDPAPTGFALVDLVGDALPDLLVLADGAAPRIAANGGNGRQWLAVALAGRWKAGADHMRTNPHGLGARVALEGQGMNVTYEHTTTEATLGQGVAPVLLGMDRLPAAALVRVRWPDGTLQCELNVPAGQVLPLVEHNRKTGSCPVLFAWDGARFVCIGDFLGGGGLGYLVAPGVYGQPDRDEAVAIAAEQLVPAAGGYRLVVAEPMDEVSYLDRLTLDVVDRPAEVTVAPDERFAPGGNRPTGALIAWRTAIAPVRATDLEGLDVTDRLMAADGRTADGFRRRSGWIGYAEEHGIVLDFGDRLARNRPGPDASLWLALGGWVEYPYSQTNYAAATAGVTLRPPVVERRRGDGSWETIEAEAGYPAGLPRLTLLDLTGKLGGPQCVLRLRTNMECYWDQAFIAVRDRAAEGRLRVTPLSPARASLGYRGFTRESSSDGRAPFLYDYDHLEPAPMARMAGRLTRYGDVAGLLMHDDDRLCVIGPGDEVRLEFDAHAAPALPPGWIRSYVLRAVGYCKDADPFTAASDDVGPLPWRGMPPYPFGPEGQRPRDAGYEEYLRTYQTRPAGGR